MCLGVVGVAVAAVSPAVAAVPVSACGRNPRQIFAVTAPAQRDT